VSWYAHIFRWVCLRKSGNSFGACRFNGAIGRKHGNIQTIRTENGCNNEIRREINKTILRKNEIAYFAPELVLLYKSTDLTRKENRQDFDMIIKYLPGENKKWLQNALTTAFPSGHEWIERLEKI
jgi:hypothetical protein